MRRCCSGGMPSWSRMSTFRSSIVSYGQTRIVIVLPVSVLTKTSPACAWVGSAPAWLAAAARRASSAAQLAWRRAAFAFCSFSFIACAFNFSWLRMSGTTFARSAFDATNVTLATEGPVVGASSRRRRPSTPSNEEPTSLASQDTSTNTALARCRWHQSPTPRQHQLHRWLEGHHRLRPRPRLRLRRRARRKPAPSRESSERARETAQSAATGRRCSTPSRCGWRGGGGRRNQPTPSRPPAHAHPRPSARRRRRRHRADRAPCGGRRGSARPSSRPP
mmetsp:Transcript_12615/g.44165  ORF Transcript_12615/g.44165 Transcript_12615/m.44165 type:complete len:277 (+) Transcript_12615:1517-2347(+)